VVANGDRVVIVQGADGLPVAFGPAPEPADGDRVVIVQGADGLPVAVQAQTPSDGDRVFIVQGADGLPVAVKFGGCSCAPYPSMLLRVTGDVTKTVNWAGETWELPDDSGLEKCVCPTRYRYYTWDYVGVGVPGWEFLHAWQAQGNRSDYQLLFQRNIWHESSFINADTWIYTGVNVNGGWARFYTPGTWTVYAGTPMADVRQYGTSTFKLTGLWWTGRRNTKINILGGFGQATYFDYLIRDEMLEYEYTFDGITYSWTKGSDWPSAGDALPPPYYFSP